MQKTSMINESNFSARQDQAMSFGLILDNEVAYIDSNASGEEIKETLKSLHVINSVSIAFFLTVIITPRGMARMSCKQRLEMFYMDPFASN